MKTTWPDGTPKSMNNAFTAHNYDPDSPIISVEERKQYQRGGFGAKNGTIPGMGKDPRAFTLHTRKKQRA